MNRPARFGAAAALLAVTPISAAGPAIAEDESPDLKLEVTGKLGERNVELKITNVSKWWADDTTLTIATTAPTATNPLTLNVGNLDPQQSVTLSYALPAPCDGHMVRVELQPAVNYAGVAETNQVNNRFNGSVCAPTSVDPGVIGIGLVTAPEAARLGDDVVQPEYMRPGPHTEPFEPGAHTVRIKSRVSFHFDIGSFRTGDVITGPRVGFSQEEYLQGDPVAIAQSALSFDLEKIAALPKLDTKKTTAVLEYKEIPVRWTSGGNDPQNKSGCVARIGETTVALEAIPDNTMLPVKNLITVPTGDLTLIPIHRTHDVTALVAPHLDSGERHLPLNLALLGALDDADGDDDTSCMSDLDDIKLKVSYEIAR